jgi:uncharacterized membrane protein YeaQ/YmgE (transglycosylase-associated protein family)
MQFVAFARNLRHDEVTVAVAEVSIRHGALTAMVTRGRRSAMLGRILATLALGLLGGVIARILVPGRHELSIWTTIECGVLGSFAGATVSDLIWHRGADTFEPGGIVASILGSVVVVSAWKQLGTRDTDFGRSVHHIRLADLFSGRGRTETPPDEAEPDSGTERRKAS